MKYFPNNKLSTYTTKLHTPLRLQGEWEVSLVEINYPRTWYNISGDTAKIKYKGKSTDRVHTVSLTPGYYEDEHEILTELRTIIPGSAQRQINLYVKAQSRKFVINLTHGATIEFHDSLARMLGLEVSGTISKNTVGSFPIDIHRGFYTFYVYSDLVNAQYVGDSLSPLLRTVDVDHSEIGGMVCRTYNSPHYLPIKNKYIETIKVDIRRDIGELVPFESGQVICKLHFRLKRSPYLM